MSRQLLRRAAVALQHALEAQTLEYQVRHADEARQAFEAAMRSTVARGNVAAARSGDAARLIAARAVGYDTRELAAFEERLRAVEELIAQEIRSTPDPRRFRRLSFDG
jgi:hypothetical protein